MTVKKNRKSGTLIVMNSVSITMGGFFHLVGLIEGGKDALHMVHETGTFDLESIGNDFEFGFTSKPAPVPSPFVASPFVRLEFQTRVPWVLDMTESD